MAIVIDSDPELVSASEEESGDETDGSSEFEMVMSDDGEEDGNNGEESGSDGDGVIDLVDSESDSDIAATSSDTSGSDSDDWSTVSAQSSASSGVDVGEPSGAQFNLLEVSADGSTPAATCYPIATTSSHLQTADAMVATTSTAGPTNGDIELLVHVNRCLEIWQLREGHATRLSTVGWAFNSYSTHMSADKTIAASGGISGWMSIYTRNPTAADPVAAAQLRVKWGIRLPTRDAMLNCIRFGRVGDRERIVLAGQDGFVYFLNVPSVNSHDPMCMACTTFNEGTAAIPGDQAGQPPPPQPQATRLHLRQVEVYSCPEPPPYFGARLVTQLLMHLPTAASGPWDYAVNSAVPSPDGRWVAVVGDELEVWLLSADTQFKKSGGVRLPVPHDPDVRRRSQSGCQYVAWSRNSQRIVASSDSAKCITVWDVQTRQETHRLRCSRACLPVCFAPWDDNLVFCGESSKYVYALMLLPENRMLRQQVRAPVVATPGARNRYPTIQGLATDGCSKLLCATGSQVVQWEVLREWSMNKHATFPGSFKAAVRVILMSALVHPHTGEPRHPTGHQYGFWNLPIEVLLHIIAHTAVPLQCWALQHQRGAIE